MGTEKFALHPSSESRKLIFSGGHVLAQGIRSDDLLRTSLDGWAKTSKSEKQTSWDN